MKLSKWRNPKLWIRKPWWIILALIIIGGGIKMFQTYQDIYGPNVDVGQKEHLYLYIPTGSEAQDVFNLIREKNILDDTASFIWLAKKKNYPRHVYPGKYKIKDGMSNNALVERLRSGKQEPVRLIFNNIRTTQELAGVVARQIEADSGAIVQLLNNETFLDQYDMTPATAPAMFLPNTYEFWWDTSAREFIQRMHKEYQNFWAEERKTRAGKMEMTPEEVITLASIVDEETLHNDEMPKIAGVYINRLGIGMRLQADPTIKYAIGDFSINRVLSKHLQVDSPYNTYKNAGLPPGPISIPSIAAIDAVLNYSEHDYLYFAAKPDFSGYHNFSENHYQHIRNAQKYQRALNKKDIME